MDPIKIKLKELLHTGGLITLIASAASFVLGTSIASYLAVSVQWQRVWLGLLFIISLHLLKRWMLHAFPSRRLQDTPPANNHPSRLSKYHPSVHFVYASFIILAVLGTSLSGFLLSGGLPVISWLLILILLLSNLAFVMVHSLRTSGLMEIWESALTAGIIPAFSFSLMAGELHRLIPMTTSALIAFWFAATIVSQLISYAEDIRLERKTLTTRIGWQKAMFVHDAALVFGILTLILAFAFGYPTTISLSLLIILPLMITQIIHMNRIRRGAPPGFRWMEWTAAAIFFLTIYLQIIGFLR